jgi:hypothetical protein
VRRCHPANLNKAVQFVKRKPRRPLKLDPKQPLKLTPKVALKLITESTSQMRFSWCAQGRMMVHVAQNWRGNVELRSYDWSSFEE